MQYALSQNRDFFPPQYEGDFFHQGNSLQVSSEKLQSRIKELSPHNRLFQERDYRYDRLNSCQGAAEGYYVILLHTSNTALFNPVEFACDIRAKSTFFESEQEDFAKAILEKSRRAQTERLGAKFLMSYIEKSFRSGKIAEVNLLIKCADFTELSVWSTIALIRSTSRVKTKLPAWHYAVQNAKEALKDRKEDVDDIFIGIN